MQRDARGTYVPTEGRPHEDTARSWPSTSQRKRRPPTPALPTPHSNQDSLPVHFFLCLGPLPIWPIKIVCNFCFMEGMTQEESEERGLVSLLLGFQTLSPTAGWKSFKQE